jgi:hypothetical protein
VVTAIIASTLGWSFDMFDLFILLYVAPAVGGRIRLQQGGARLLQR